MKKRVLEKQLIKYGWWKYGEGSKHEKWTNGAVQTTLPRHREINEITARAILKLAQHSRRKK